MHAVSSFAEWCKRVDGMDRGRKRAYFRSETPVPEQPCVNIRPLPEAIQADGTAAERQGFIDGVIAELQAIDGAIAVPINATLDALIAEAPVADSDQHADTNSSGL